MSYDHNGLLSSDHGVQCPECGCKSIYFSIRARDKVVLRCGNCGKRFSVIDAERKIHPMITNADNVRAMNDEKLAWFFAKKISSCYGCESSTMEDCAHCWLDWLKSEKK